MARITDIEILNKWRLFKIIKHIYDKKKLSIDSAVPSTIKECGWWGISILVKDNKRREKYRRKGESFVIHLLGMHSALSNNPLFRVP